MTKESNLSDYLPVAGGGDENRWIYAFLKEY